MSVALALVASSLLAEPVLDVSVDPAIDDAAQVRDWIEKDGTAVLRDRDVESTATEKAWRIAIAVSGSTYDYDVELKLERAGSPLADQPAPFGCECNNEQLIEKIEAAIGSAVDTLQEPESTPPPAPKDVALPPDEDPDPEPRRLGPMGITGAIFIPLGAGAAIAGGVLIARGEVVEGSGAQQESTNYRPAGIGLVAGGAAVLVTGIALLVADRVKAKRQVAFAPSGRGFIVHGRF